MRYNYNISGNSNDFLTINHDNIYIHYDIKLIDKGDISNNIYPVYQYDEIIMSKDEYLEYLQEQTTNNSEAVLELSYYNPEKQESIDVISFYADGTKTDFIPDATAAGALWAQQVMFNKTELNQVPIQYRDEVKYRLDNNILN